MWCCCGRGEPDEDGGECGKVIAKLVLEGCAEASGFFDAEVRGNRDRHVGMQPVADPARLRVGDPSAGHVLGRMVDFIGDVRLDAIEHARQHRLADCQTMPKIAIVMSRPTIGSASGKPSQTPIAPSDDGKAGQPVGAGVVAVGDQRRAVDLAADADAEHRHRLVAEKADDAGGGDASRDASIGCGWISRSIAS